MIALKRTLISLVALCGFVTTPTFSAETYALTILNGIEAGNGPSLNPSTSQDGRFVAFDSWASNLVPNDDFGFRDIFVYDRDEGTIERVSINSGGAEGGNGHSSNPSISADGRFVAFASEANNLSLGDVNTATDIFVHDRDTNTTERVSVRFDGSIAGNANSFNPSISADGRFVAFESDASDLVLGDNNGVRDIFVHDRETDTSERVSIRFDGSTEGNAASSKPSISANGLAVAFQSHASNLVLGDRNRVEDIFVHDREAGITERVSVNSAATSAGNRASSNPSINADGRFVAFESEASNLVNSDGNGVVDIFFHDRDNGNTDRISVKSAGSQAGNNASFNPSISADGQFVAFESRASNLVSGDNNATTDIFVHDRNGFSIERVSVTSAGAAEGNNQSFKPSISADGNFVAFQSDASNFAFGDGNEARDIFIRDRVQNTTEWVSNNNDVSKAGNDSSKQPSISADGRYVAFESRATNLVPNDNNDQSDVFVHDRETGTIERVSVRFDGSEGGNDASFAPSISADGRYVAFASSASNLVLNDGNGFDDVFVRDRVAGTTERVSIRFDGSIAGNSSSGEPSISADGRFVAFHSSASNLVLDDGNSFIDVFVRDREAGTTELVSIRDGSNLGSTDNLDSSNPSISADGRVVAFLSLELNDVTILHVSVHDRETGTTLGFNIRGGSGAGISSGPSISADGRFVAIHRFSLYVFDREELTITQTVLSSDGSASISDDGRFVAYEAIDPVTGLYHVFLNDRDEQFTERLSVVSESLVATPSISADGRFVTFGSDASNLIPGDDNNLSDIFVTDLGAPCDVNDPANQITLKSNQWYQLALPCLPPQGASVADVFDSVLSPEQYSVFFYNGQNYSPANEDSPMSPGQGLWFLQNSGSQVNVTLPTGSRSGSSNFNASECDPINIGCQSIPLTSPRWQMLGIPFSLDGGIPLDDVRVTTSDGDTCVDGCVIGNNITPVSNTLFHYDSDAGTYKTVRGDDIDASLEVWAGYWVSIAAGSNPEGPALLLPELRSPDLVVSGGEGTAEGVISFTVNTLSATTRTFSIRNVGDAMATNIEFLNVQDRENALLRSSTFLCGSPVGSLAPGASCDVTVNIPAPGPFDAVYEQNNISVRYQNLYQDSLLTTAPFSISVTVPNQL